MEMISELVPEDSGVSEMVEAAERVYEKTSIGLLAAGAVLAAATILLIWLGLRRTFPL
jgi:hypothetical protein